MVPSHPDLNLPTPTPTPTPPYPAATRFLSQFEAAHRLTHAAEVQLLSAIVRKEHLASHELALLYRQHRLEIEV